MAYSNQSRDECRRFTPGELTLAVYAPFGTDAQLSTFPNGTTTSLLEHPLVKNLQAVAGTGVGVAALVDMFDSDTWLVVIPPFQPEAITVASRGKLQMDAGNTLKELLVAARSALGGCELILAMEGHGAGFMPELDHRQMTLENETANGDVEWRLGGAIPGQLTSRPLKSDGDPLIEKGAPVLPVVGPTCPANHLVLSTWAVGDAFQQAERAGVPRLPVVHFNNCFNMSTELLHTVAPYAEFATGYCNYNFFSAGAAYPMVFEHLARQGGATAGEIARWFAFANHAVLQEAGHEPTVAGTVELARMHEIAERVDDLSDALLAALRTSSAAERPAIVAKIRDAIVAAQQYDTRPDYILETPDELTDLDSLAAALLDVDFLPYKVAPAAEALREALCGIKQYGDTDSPWMDPNVVWDFSSPNLAMNILLPDPLLEGLWDWRSQYYLDVNPDPGKPPIQPHIIEFVKVTDWVDFLIEYHREASFQGLLAAEIPDLPLATHPYDPRRCRGGSREDGRDGKSTYLRRG